MQEFRAYRTVSATLHCCIAVNPPSPDRGLTQIIIVNVTQEFGVYGVRTAQAAAFWESALEVAGWGKAGTMRDLNLCWPFFRLPPTKRAFLTFFLRRFFFFLA